MEIQNRFGVLFRLWAKVQTNLAALKVDDVTLTDDLEIAETMKSYFSTAFSTEDFGNFPVYSNVLDSKLSTTLGI